MTQEVEQGPVSESRFSENSELVNPEMRETLVFRFQLNSESVTLATYSVNLTCSLAGFLQLT